MKKKCHECGLSSRWTELFQSGFVDKFICGLCLEESRKSICDICFHIPCDCDDQVDSARDNTP